VGTSYILFKLKKYSSAYCPQASVAFNKDINSNMDHGKEKVANPCSRAISYINLEQKFNVSNTISVFIIREQPDG
jgi:hypothetical protein